MADAQDDLAGLGISIAPPPSLAAGNARQPLGPPQGFYTEQAMVNPALAGFIPYVNGDEWTPAYNLSTEDRDRLKSRMNAAGLYGTTGYSSGTWTQDDANAYQIVLEAANGAGVRDENVVIDNLANEARSGARVQGPRAPLVSRISNPDDIRAILRQSAYDLTGRRLSDEDEQRLISMYQGQQGASDAAANAGAGMAAGSSTTVTNEASMQNFANAQIEAMNPGDVQNVRAMNFMDTMLKSIGTTQIQGPANYSGEGLPKAGSEVL